MAKKYLDIHIDQTPPVGAVTDATVPIAVRARVRWNIGPAYVVVENAWAMAWTAGQVLVFWRTSDAGTATVAWLRADQVRRR